MTQACIIVSPYFPPSTLAGVHRARHLAKHLPAHGWHPILVRVDERYYKQSPDLALGTLVPETVEQIRVAALPSGIARLAGIGDIGLRAYFALARAVESAMRRTSPAAVLITGSPFYPMLLSNWIQRRLKVPVVLDFQDPWVSAHGATLPGWSKAGVSHRLAVALEPRAVRHASFVTSVSENQNARMAQMYPWLDSTRMAAVPIGGDPDDFDTLRTAPITDPQVRLDPALLHLSYVGTFLPRAAPLVRAVFQAVRLLRDAQPRLAEKVRLNFVGTSNQLSYSGSGPVSALAHEAGIPDLVNEYPQRVPYLEALGILAKSTGLLLIGSDEVHYTASKIYPALMSGRPYVSLFHRASSAHQILSAAGGGHVFSFGATSELPALTTALSESILALATRPNAFGQADPAVYSAYSAYSVARQFAQVFETVSK